MDLEETKNLPLPSTHEINNNNNKNHNKQSPSLVWLSRLIIFGRASALCTISLEGWCRIIPECVEAKLS